LAYLERCISLGWQRTRSSHAREAVFIRQFIMALLRAYLDASFTQPKGVTSIGGFIGSEPTWSQIDRDWSEALSLWSLDDFHLTDLLAGNTHLGRKRGELCALYFANIVGNSGLHNISSSFRDEDWTSPRRELDAARYPEPYHLCLSLLLDILSTHMKLEFPGDTVHIIADSDTGKAQAALTIVEDHRGASGSPIVSFEFGDRRKFPRLQCADLFAGEERKAWLGSNSWRHPDVKGLYAIALSGKGRSSYWSAETERRINELREQMKAQKEALKNLPED
jgi:hypothetical protein